MSIPATRRGIGVVLALAVWMATPLLAQSRFQHISDNDVASLTLCEQGPINPVSSLFDPLLQGSTLSKSTNAFQKSIHPLCFSAGLGEPQSAKQGNEEPVSNRAEKLSRSTKNTGDRNRNIYYKNKLEFSLEGGWLPINIPFVFDFLLGDGYKVTGLNYTLVPIIASVRWQLDDVRGPVILRGNWDATFSASITAIPRGPETHYFAYIMGIRRDFVPRNWKVVPYLDGRLGMGDIDAKGPLGVLYAQGHDFTFTLNLGSGLRYNVSPTYAIQAGMNYMHISNLYLSQPKFLNYGINVYGPLVGIDIRFGKHRPSTQ